MSSIIFNGTTKGGTFKVFRRNDMQKEVLAAFPEKDLIIKIERKKKIRSNQQNRYYWSVIIKLMTDFFKGEGIVRNEQETHDILKFKFLKVAVSVVEETGEVIERIKSTTELSTTEFEDYALNIRQWTHEFFGVEIPEPNEQIAFFE